MKSFQTNDIVYTNYFSNGPHIILILQESGKDYYSFLIIAGNTIGLKSSGDKSYIHRVSILISRSSSK